MTSELIGVVAAVLASPPSATNARVAHAYVQTIEAPPERVLPLLTAEREGEWAEGWSPRIVEAGTAPGGEDGVFVTTDEDGETLWTSTLYDPAAHRVEYVRVLPGVELVRIRIRLERAQGERTHAHVAYAWTALGERGEQRIARMTRARFETNMRHWERALNHYLQTGRRLPSDDPH
jgi:hypothetical protein